MVVRGSAFIVEGQEDHYLHAGSSQFSGFFTHLLLIASLEEVGNEYHYRVQGTGDDLLAVGKCCIDVSSTSQLHTKKQFYRIGEFFGEISHIGVEDDHLGVDGRNA